MNGGLQNDVPPEPVNITLFGKKVFADIIKDLEIKSHWIVWVDPKSDNVSSSETDGEKPETQRRPVRMRAEMGARRPQAEEQQELPAAGTGQEGFPLGLWREPGLPDA